MGKKHKRDLPVSLLERIRKRKDFVVCKVIHADDHINVSIAFKHLTGLLRIRHPYEFRRIAQVKFNVFLINLAFYLTVFLKYKGVIIAANHQDLSNPELDK